MLSSNDFILSQLTVRLRNSQTKAVIGSGIIYQAKFLRDKVYIFTAAHCLFADNDKFSLPFHRIIVDIYQPSRDQYVSLDLAIDHNLVSADTDRDVAILIVEKSIIEPITGPLPEIVAIGERQSVTTFVAKGFPNATQGRELDMVQPVWKQQMTKVSKFQLQLNENYSEWATKGFSGSGIFLHADDHLYLYGIFTRFRPEDSGKVVYGQYLYTINELLKANFQVLIPISFFGEHGLNNTFFARHIGTAVKNLGPRFNEKLNLRMPVSKFFNVIAKDERFKKTLLAYFDQWLTTKNYRPYHVDNLLIREIEQEYASTREFVKTWVGNISWQPGETIELDNVTDALLKLNEMIVEKRGELYDLRREKQKEEIRKERDYSYKPPFESELDRLYNLSSENDDLLGQLETAGIGLANSPFLLIKGEAGCGKSHLLGDIATLRNKANRPSILLLGQLFRKEQSLWQNILAQLNLSCSKDELLLTINEIGRQIGSRVLILIDALNEGDGKAIWPHELAGFIDEVGQFPYIGLVMTIRTTYWNAVIPKSVQSDSKITRITHEGFKGNEYAAMKLFCAYYGLQQPNFPILAPEYANPLFLQLVCEGVKASPEKKFPQGFQGISSLFGYYVNAVTAKLGTKNEAYALRKTLAEQAIREIGRATFANDSRPLTLDAAVTLFDNKFPTFPLLLNDLIQENVLIQSLRNNYETDADEEIVYFSYERFGDFFIAQDILSNFKTREEVIDAFQMQNALGKMLIDQYYIHSGILEALAVLLPEKFDLEIFEVFDWAFNSDDSHTVWIADEWINNRLVESLKWRSVSSVNDQKLTEWINSEKFGVDDDSFLNALLELSPVKQHPFNSDRLCKVWNKKSMAQRDGFLQKFFYYYQGYGDGGEPFAIRRIIEWAWQPGISSRIDKETARLIGQSLAWLLSSTYRKLRDEATKALVNLLEEQPEALIGVMNAFADTDDFYIRERLYAVAYGCALRTAEDKSLALIAQYIFDTTFTGNAPPANLLLRDYARNTVEYALYKALTIEGDMRKIKPPYRSLMPEFMPSQADISKYEIDHDTPGFKENYGREHNRIIFSVTQWDFSRYTIESAFRGFSPASFRIEEEIKQFLKSLKSKKRDLVRLFMSIYGHLESVIEQEKNGRVFRTFNNGQTFKAFHEECLEHAQNRIATDLDEAERRYVNEQIVPQIVLEQRSKDTWHRAFDTQPIKYWIVQRVFELGYQVELHGDYDSQEETYNRHSENKVERIGKKYQWIAFFEMLAYVADNHFFKESFSSRDKYAPYQGPWQNYLRDVDPVFITKNTPENDEINEDVEAGTEPYIADSWWSPEQYLYWNQPNADWAVNKLDMPDPARIIGRRDEYGKDWVYLSLNVNWKEPKPLGEDKYDRLKKDIWYGFQAYLIKKSSKTKIMQWMEQQNFYGRWMPETHSLSGLYNRENYWSPASKYYQKGRRIWESLDGIRHKVALATAEAVGEMGDDRSGAHFSYKMPSQLLFEGMGLQYAPNDGEFKNAHGEIIVTNINPQGVLMRKKDLLEFLEKNGLEIVWTLLGEKNVWSSDWQEKDVYLKAISGVYAFNEGGSLAGDFRILERN